MNNISELHIAKDKNGMKIQGYLLKSNVKSYIIPQDYVDAIENENQDLDLFYWEIDPATLKRVAVNVEQIHGNMGVCPNCNKLINRAYATHFCNEKDCGMALKWSDE